jgi:VanZ family protein
MKAPIRILLFKLPALAYMGIIFFLSSGPIDLALIQQVPDYYLHAFGYSVLYVLLFWAVHEHVRPARRGGYWLPFALTVFYGATDEYHQSFVPTREASFYDLAADAAGGLVGIVWVVLAAWLLSSFTGGDKDADS